MNIYEFENQAMPSRVQKPSTTSRLEESLFHLERLIIAMKEWQTDWSALRPKLEDGSINPDFDFSYLQRVTQHPEKVFDPRILEAEDFLKRAR